MEKTKLVPAAEPVAAPLEGKTPPPRRILVVDDDGDMRRLNTEVLIHHGYHMDAAEDAAAAWDTLQLSTYDLLVTDNKMCRVTGIGLIKKLRAARMALPVIMATGTLPNEELTRYPWLQPAAILIKPYTITELVGTVKEVLRATASAHEQTAPPQNWQGQPLLNGLPL